MKKIVLLSLILGLVGCGKDENKINNTKSKFEVRLGENVIECGSNSASSNKEYTLVKDIKLLTEPNATAQFVINSKATAYSGRQEYRTLHTGETVRESCTQGEYIFLTTSSDPHILENSGWAKISDLKSESKDKYAGRIASFVIEQRDPEYYSGELEKFLNIKPSIQELEVQAAKKALDSGKCDFVVDSMLDKFGNDVNQPNVDVTCRNKKKFRLSKNEILNSNSYLESNAEKAVSKEVAIEKCKSLILPNLMNGNTAKFREIIGSSYYLNQGSGNVQLLLDFSAENKLGNIQNFKGKCIFSPDGTGEVVITQQ